MKFEYVGIFIPKMNGINQISVLCNGNKSPLQSKSTAGRALAPPALFM